MCDVYVKQRFDVHKIICFAKHTGTAILSCTEGAYIVQILCIKAKEAQVLLGTVREHTRSIFSFPLSITLSTGTRKTRAQKATGRLVI